MKNLIKKAALFMLLPVSLLTSCGGESVPAKGYSMYKKQNSDYMISIGGTGKEITYNSCKYAYITGSGKIDAQDLAGTVYYFSNWTMTLGGHGTNMNAYFLYNSKQNYVSELDDSNGATAFSYAVSLINDGSLKGEIGNL